MFLILVFILLYSADAHAAAQCKKAIADAECRIACQSKGYDGGYVADKMCACIQNKNLADLLDQTIKLPRRYIESQRKQEDDEEY